MNFPTTEEELDLYFFLQRLVKMEEYSKRFVMDGGKPKYNDKSVEFFKKAKENYLKKVNKIK